jgi:hypothetical protein
MIRPAPTAIKSAGRIAAAAAVCCAFGLQWLGLQSAAWTTMFLHNASHTSLIAAVSKTLDGSHPCSLCHLVRHGQKSERQSELQQSTAKIDLMYSVRHFRFSPRLNLLNYPRLDVSALGLVHSAPSPPPRRSELTD